MSEKKSSARENFSVQSRGINTSTEPAGEIDPVNQITFGGEKEADMRSGATRGSYINKKNAGREEKRQRASSQARAKATHCIGGDNYENGVVTCSSEKCMLRSHRKLCRREQTMGEKAIRV
ncbi:hypothetical protein CAPTEDRAFT_194259 [Capitella teleta]|uniref:Uncharacterized protein n=1 Tax=Capitella teleta TaxID=283909 RepID=R7TET8_CAPTE|nr:hypothetical protein CAPTEDRAFT_194259 [Capitella teleta]|eukprot:ELT89581.1 hypothetical protein CAPTEDRAFT_194259 [Capitella teleta]